VSDLNVISVTGRVGSVDFKTTPGGMKVLSISLAVGGTKKVNGNWEKVTTWLKTAAFDKRAEALSNLITKGSRIGVTGTLEVREFEAKDGSKGKSVEINANDIVLLDSKRDGGQRQEQSPAYGPGAADETDIPFGQVDGRLL
jgi:single-strand DNA-binding protein